MRDKSGDNKKHTLNVIGVDYIRWIILIRLCKIGFPHWVFRQPITVAPKVCLVIVSRKVFQSRIQNLAIKFDHNEMWGGF